MKKIIALILCLIFVFSFAGCKKTEKSSATIDIEYYANLGKMPEIEFSLGSDPKTVKEKLEENYDKYLETEKDNDDHNHDHDATAITFNEIEGKKNVLLSNGVTNYYYVKEKEDEGIAYIVNKDRSFDFELGTSIIDVKTALGDTKYNETEVTEENAFFATAVTDGTLLEIVCGDIVTLFVFQENELYATAMYNKKVWN